jgi:hypothetical protein
MLLYLPLHYNEINLEPSADATQQHPAGESVGT